MIKVSELKKSFGKKVAIDGINLNISHGEKVALIGQNGSGKTTLIRCLLGLYRYQGGIFFSGKNIFNNRQWMLSQCAFVPQVPPPLKSSVAEILVSHQEICQAKRETFTSLFEQLGFNFQDCQNRPFKNLSGGMKQKLLLACAFARRPKLLILDEPTSNLDPQARPMFYELLKSMPSETSVLMASHRVDELAGIVNRLIELDSGRIAQDQKLEIDTVSQLNDQFLIRLSPRQLPIHVQDTMIKLGYLQTIQHKNEWQIIIGAPDLFRHLAMWTKWTGVIGELEIKSHKQDQG